MKEKSQKKFITTGVLSVEHDGNEKLNLGMFRSPNKACRKGRGISMK